MSLTSCPVQYRIRTKAGTLAWVDEYWVVFRHGVAYFENAPVVVLMTRTVGKPPLPADLPITPAP